MSRKLSNDSGSITKRNMRTLKRLAIMDCIIGTIFLIFGFLQISVHSYGYALLYLALAAAFLGLAGMYRYRYKKLNDRNI